MCCVLHGFGECMEESEDLTSLSNIDHSLFELISSPVGLLSSATERSKQVDGDLAGQVPA